MKFASKHQAKIRQCHHLTQEFFARFSAAGIGRIYGSRNAFRKLAWCATVLLTAFLMGYMTYRVTFEYFEYKKTVEINNVILNSMDFPAVTVCNPVMLPKSRIKRAGMMKLLDLETFVKNIDGKESNKEERLFCNRDPACSWSWFEGRCICVNNPCYAEYCQQGFPMCYCSSMLCDEHNRTCIVRQNSSDGSDGECFCKNKHFKIVRNDENVGATVDRSAVLKTIHDKELRDLISIIRDSKMDDLSDVQWSFQPDLFRIADVGTSYDNLIIGCTFNKEPCDQRNFTVFYTSSHGKCYTFNYVGELAKRPGPPLETKKYGWNSGLQLYLQIRDDEIVDILTKEVGVIVAVHDPREIPYVSEFGLTISVGDSASLRVQRLQSSRLGPPWGMCLHSGTHLPFNYSDQPYSQLGCQRYCQNFHVFKKCRCYKRSLIPPTTVMPKKTDDKVCDTTNSTERQCSDDVIEMIENGTIICNCFQACRENVYQTSVTAGQINKSYFRIVKASKTLRIVDNSFGAAITSQTNNLLGLKVYYGTLSLQNSTEWPSYSWEKLIANLGGNLGFFMGLTLITFFEIAELLCDLLIYAIKRFL